MRRGRFDEALREARTAVLLAPMSARFEHAIGEVFLSVGRGDEALAAARKALAIEPSSAPAYYLAAHAHLQRGRPDEAEAALRRCLELRCGDSGRALLGYVHAITGRRAAARRVVDSLRTRWMAGRGRGHEVIALGIAQVLVGLGERDEALDWLERGVGSPLMVYLAIEPIFRPLRGEPRFHSMLRTWRLAE
jgi:Flp pilus assembly protein TadD